MFAPARGYPQHMLRPLPAVFLVCLFAATAAAAAKVPVAVPGSESGSESDLASAASQSGLRLSVQRWQYEDWQLHDLEIRWYPAAEAGSAPRLTLRIGDIERGAQRLGGLSWRCDLQPSTADPAMAAACAGVLRWSGKALGRLQYQHAEIPQLSWQQDKRSVQLRLSSDAAELRWKHLALALLRPLLSEWWPSLQSLAGDAQGSARWDWNSERGEAQFRLAQLNLDAEGGDVALADVALSGQAQWQGLEQISELEASIELESGEGLLTPLYTAFERGTRVELSMRAAADGSDAWRLGIRDPHQQALRLQAQLPSGEDWSKLVWNADIELPDLSDALVRYLETPLATLGWRGPALSGGLSLKASGAADQLDSLELGLDALSLSAEQPPLALDGLDGKLLWHREQSGLESHLDWQRLAPWGFELGGGNVQLSTEQGAWVLRSPLGLSLHGGSVSVFPLQIAPVERELSFGLSTQSVDLGPLSKQFGWPQLPGQLSAELPAARFSANRLAIDGDIQVQVFDGQVVLGNLSLERPFGIAPAFAADIAIDDLDLGPLTSAFGFGEITGRLDGTISGLRTLDWAPVAFDARLFSDPNFRGKKRISQRAVQDLSSVGGGIIAGLQQTVLKVFESFSYQQIGLSCRLANNVCEMGGIDGSGNGYTVVEGSGLPRITVKGFQRRVDWPVLLKRLKSAVERGVVIGDG